jgi:hypothetical protein
MVQHILSIQHTRVEMHLSPGLLGETIMLVGMRADGAGNVTFVGLCEVMNEWALGYRRAEVVQRAKAT